MHENSPQRSRWKPFLVGAGTGCLPGFLVGLVAGAAIGIWAWIEFGGDQPAHPLADLDIPAGRLTIDETRPPIDRLARAYLSDANNVGLVVGVLKEGEQRVFGYGRVTRDGDRTPDGETVFEIASVGKTFTTTLLAEMHLVGELSWDDALSGFLPDGVRVPKYGGKEITLLDLATQTAGLPSLPPNFHSTNPLNPYADYTVGEMYAGLGQITLDRLPGADYEYSNLGFGLLGHALERRGGTTFEDLVVSRLCKPLGMESTRMTLDDSLKARLATPHADGKPVAVWEDTTMPGAGSFLSTADDMLRFVEAHWQADENDASALSRALRETTRKRRPADVASRSMGLGWHIDSEHALDIIWHNGGSGGSRSYVAFLREPRVGVVVLSNSTSEVNDLGRKVLYLLAVH
jgi:CubicO group peptidase (beta-lactamase class C family)